MISVKCVKTLIILSIISNMHSLIELALPPSKLKNTILSSPDPIQPPINTKSNDKNSKNPENSIEFVKYKDSKNNLCNMKVIREFFTLKDEKDFNVGDSKRKSICPNKTYFCCSVTEIMFLVSQFKKGRKDIELLNEYHNFFYHNFRMNSFKQLKKLILNWKNQKSKSFFKQELFENFDKEIEYIQKKIEKINLSFIIVKDFILRFYSGIVCEICSPRSSQAFDFDSANDSHGTTLLQVSFSIDFYTELINVNTYFAYYLKFLAKLTNLVELYVLYLGDQLPPRKIKTDAEYQKQLETYLFCKQHLREGEGSKRGENVKSVCAGAFDLIGDLRKAKGVKKIGVSLQTAHDFFSNIFPVNYYELSEQRRITDAPAFYNFIDTTKTKKIVPFTKFKADLKFKKTPSILNDKGVIINKNVEENEYFRSDLLQKINPIDRAMANVYLYGSAMTIRTVLLAVFEFVLFVLIHKIFDENL